MSPKYRRLHDKPRWLNKDDSYMSEDQIVKHFVAHAKTAAAMWRNMPLREVARLHSTLGKEVRNDYGLWDAENPHTVQTPGKGENGTIDHPLFPDQVSFRILQRVWGEFHR
jgi:hypothetical protein